jgi:coenzyme F420-reducing hydrogenase delta subunit/predicted CopG family antitoxin
MSFEPKILGFLCNWCSYAGADLAGVSRIQYPPNLRVIRVMCSGRVDPEFIFEGFLQGLDGIIVMGCHPGDCHYLEGNYEAERKYEMVSHLLGLINMDDRVDLKWVSASEGKRFAEVITNFTNKITELGPSPLGDGGNKSLLKKMKAAKKAVSDYRLRALVGRKRTLIEKGNVYDEKVLEEKFDEIFLNAINDEFTRQRIILSLEEAPKSVLDISKELKVNPEEILNHILILKGRSQVGMNKILDTTPIYEYTMEG